VKAIADRVTILRRGRTVATLPAAEAQRRSLAALMVGREVELVERRSGSRELGETCLELDRVSADGDRGLPAVKEVSLAVRRGEIVAIAGVAGNGQRELAEAITGIRPPSSGSVAVDGRKLRASDPRSAIAAGVAHVPEDRLGTAVAPSRSISENAVLKSYRGTGVSRGPLMLWRRVHRHAHDLIHRYAVHTPGPHLRARDLSGGNLQKLVLGREFAGEPRVLIAASPTRGLDVGAIETVHAYLREVATRGVAVLLISEDLDEILALSDRVVVMYEGELTGEFDPAASSVEDVGLAMAGGERE
jgi:simple sugar transport system ATP-binding protein